MRALADDRRDMESAREAAARLVNAATCADDIVKRTTALYEVFMNLMLNAIEAMKDTGGELTITSQMREESELLIAVSDTGGGLPADNPEQIFESFVITKPEGTGMGLAIARSIVESHGGRLWATANSGPGATFLFTLPGDAGH